ncbi:DUF721 domain-containing protein [Acidisoma cellulosilytica]|uniref:DUF721 domain-containing protein n=2 Tax=Acidisoma cellulosilyticum TaxID=2802395 RepID=A0A963Z0Y4_9PROT|nr:DUF721 domain-containing protein [Acidisoma cellulosilyticum]
MRPIGGLIARVTQPGFRRRAPATAQIMMDWVQIMGPEFGARTQPQKFSAGTLTIACQGPTAMELQHLTPQLIARLNNHIGSFGENALIKRLRFVQLTTLPASARPVAPVRKPRPAGPPPEISGIEPGPLHDALQRLGLAIRIHRGGG